MKLPVYRHGEYTQSSICCYNECPRKYYNKYVLGRRVVRREGGARNRGTLVHLAIERVWKGGAVHDTELAIMAAVADLPPSDAVERTVCEAVVRGYLQHWGLPAKIVGVEIAFSATFGTRRVRGALDAIVEEPHGQMIVEHKSTSGDISPGDARWLVRLYHPQTALYSWAFPETKGTILDSIRIPMLRQTKKETLADFHDRVFDTLMSSPHDYYQRVHLSYTTQYEHQRALVDIDLALTQLERTNVEHMEAWRRVASACVTPMGRCEYLDVCAGVASIDDEQRYKHGPKFPELEAKP